MIPRIMTTLHEKQQAQISLHVSADIRSGEFPRSSPSSCVIQYSLVSLQSSNWEVVSGEASGTTQRSFGDGSFLVWNCPLDCSFAARHFRGWPRLLLTLFAKDWLGRDYVFGYGSCYVPTQSGLCIKSIQIFRPRATSWFRDMMGYLTCERPSLIDPEKSFTTLRGGTTRRSIPMVNTGCTIEVQFQTVCDIAN